MSITFDGVNSDDLGVIVERIPNPQIAARRANTEVVPGRNGVLLQDDGSFATVNQTYEMHISADGGELFRSSARNVAAWLLSKAGFLRLEDSYEPDVFRLARYSGGIDITSYFYDHGRFQCEFECQPQRFLKLGETEIAIESAIDSGGLYIGEITINGIPYGATAFYIRSTGGSPLAVGEYTDASGNIIEQFYSDPVEIPNGAVGARLAWSNAGADTILIIGFVDSSGNEQNMCGVVGVSPTVYNPTQFEARPLLKFVDTSTAPEYVSQTLTMRDDYIIDNGGNVIDASYDASLLGSAVSNPVSCSGKANARVTGNGYSFLDSNGKTKRGGFRRSGSINYNGTTVAVPSWAASIVVSKSANGSAALSLQEPRANPGASAVTINGTTVSIDFSARDVIYLDCDLHDAYYADGSNANAAVSFSSGLTDYPTFPGFEPGENTVMVRDGDNLDFSVIPRWWVL